MKKVVDELLSDIFPGIQDHQKPVLKEFVVDLIVDWPEIQQAMDKLPKEV